jgi:phosphoadenosine phosphosulfate reductase
MKSLAVVNIGMDAHKLEVVKRFKKDYGNKAILAFSCGKDSIAALLLLRKFGFELKAYFMYVVPDLGFQERYLQYIQRVFGLEIERIPHPMISTNAKEGAYRPINLDKSLDLGFRDAEESLKGHFQIAWTTGGEKMIDSLQRRGMIHVNNGIDLKRGRFFPLAQWNNRDVFAICQTERVMMPPDYIMGKSSWGGLLNGTWLSEIKKRYPEDYRKILKHYPFAEAAIVKLEMETRALNED